MVGDVSLHYYRKKETGNGKHPPQRVVPIEVLGDTLMGVHSQLSHGGTENGEILDRALHSFVRPCDTALFRYLPELSGDKREEEHAQDYTS